MHHKGSPCSQYRVPCPGRVVGNQGRKYSKAESILEDSVSCRQVRECRHAGSKAALLKTQGPHVFFDRRALTLISNNHTTHIGRNVGISLVELELLAGIGPSPHFNSPLRTRAGEPETALVEIRNSVADASGARQRDARETQRLRRLGWNRGATGQGQH